MAESAPIFVVGTGRSGTTLLRRVLCAHPRIHIAHELSFYVWRDLAGRRRDAASFVRYFFRTFSFRWQRLDPAEVLRRLPSAPDRPEALPAVFETVMRCLAEREGKARFGDKTPGHASHLAQIYADFPEARVVHVVRDPRGTLPSLARMPWASGADLANAFLYEGDFRATEAYRERLLRVRLEDLVAEPEPTLRRVLDFVGEPFDPRVLEHSAHPPHHDGAPPLPWLAGAARPVATGRAAGASLPPLRLRKIEWLCRRAMAAYGYAPADPAEVPEFSPLRLWLAILREVPETVRTVWILGRLMARYRDPANFDDPATDALFARLNPGAWRHYPGFEMPRPPPLPAAESGPAALTAEPGAGEHAAR